MTIRRKPIAGEGAQEEPQRVGVTALPLTQNFTDITISAQVFFLSSMGLTELMFARR